MPRPDKVQAVEDIKGRWEAAQATFLTEYRGMTVSQLRALRRSLRSAGAEYKVFKMTLARLAAGDLGLNDITEHLSGPTGMTFATGDPVAAAKALRDFAKDNDRLVIKAGLLGRTLLQPEQVSKLADVEPREVLLSKIAGAAKAPMAKLAGLMAAFTRNAATLFLQLIDKKTPPDEPPVGEPAAVEVAAEVTPETTDDSAVDTLEAAAETSDEPAGEAAAETSDEPPGETATETADESVATEDGPNTDAGNETEEIVSPTEEATEDVTEDVAGQAGDSTPTDETEESPATEPEVTEE